MGQLKTGNGHEQLNGKRVHSSRYMYAPAGARILIWLASLANELRIPLKQKTMLKVDDKIQTMYHDGEIVEDTRNDLKL